MLSDDVMCLFLDLMDEISGETPPDDTMFLMVDSVDWVVTVTAAP